MLRDRYDPDREIYIGETQFSHPTIARLAPLAKLVDGEWEPVTDAVAQFPSEGLVFSVDAKLKNRGRGLITLFTTTPNEDSKDQFKTDEVCEPFEIITDFKGLPRDEIRRRLTRGSVVRWMQEEPRVIVALDRETFVMPILERDALTGGWCLAYDQNLAALPVYRMPDGLDGHTRFDRRSFAVPGLHVSEQVGAVNWQNDTDFVSQLLKFLRRSAPLMPNGELAQLSKSAVERLVTAFRESAVLTDGIYENSALRERLATFIRHLDVETDAIDRIAEELFALPQVRKKVTQLTQSALAQAKEEELVRLREALRVEAEAALADLKAQRATCEADLVRLEAARDELVREIEDAKATRDAEMETLRKAVEALGSGAASAVGTISRVAELAREYGIELTGKRADRQDAAADVAREALAAPWSRPRTADKGELILPADLPARAAVLAKTSGIRSEDLARLDAFARAGDVPVLVGPARERVATAYADLVCGGAIARMPLDPTVLGPEDLWTRTGAPTPLARAWTSAEFDPTALVLVRLDGLDQAGLADWFSTFVSLFRDTRPANLVVFAVGGEKASRHDEGGTSRIEIEAAFAPGASLAIMQRRPISRTRLSLEQGTDFDEEELEHLVEAVVSSDIGPRGAEVALARYRILRVWLTAEQAIAAVLASLRLPISAAAPQKQPA